MSKSNDGKKLEKEVTAYLKKRMRDPEFWSYRFPDAHRCMGRLPAQPADYLILYKDQRILLDPKDSKSDRVNFKSRFSQLPKMNRFEMAWGFGYFLVHATETDLYHIISAREINEMKEAGMKSLKLSDIYGYESAKAALDVILMGG